MLSSWALFVISTGYVALLFGVAYFGDRKARLAGAPTRKPWVYSLALGVYCTSWTFYGAVGRAATSGASTFFDNAMLIAAMLAAFAILFGTREVLSSENHHGMVLAIAFESIVKLLAFMAVGAYAVYVLRGGFEDAYAHAMALPQMR